MIGDICIHCESLKDDKCTKEIGNAYECWVIWKAWVNPQRMDG